MTAEIRRLRNLIKELERQLKVERDAKARLRANGEELLAELNTIRMLADSPTTPGDHHDTTTQTPT